MTIKEIRNIETNQLTGYQLNEMFVPLELNNRHYQEIQKAIKKGIKPEPAFTEEERLNYFKEKTLDMLNKLADDKTNEVKYYLAGQKVTLDQLERYKIKYQQAIRAIENNDYSFFEAEAKLKGIPPEKLANLVKEMGDKWNQEIAYFTSLIEAYRVKAKEIILNTNTIDEFKLIQKFIDHARTLPGNITIDDVVNLFNKYEDIRTKLLNKEITIEDVTFDN